MKNVLIILLIFCTCIARAQSVQSLSYYADKCSGLKIGTAVGSQFYYEYDTNSNYDKAIKDNFNILVAENEMKYDATEPNKGVFSFTKPDILVSYAQRNGKQVRGHNLCWHSQLPSWITAGLTNGTANGTFTKETLMAILKNHITTIVTRYKGKVQQWDVVNEPFNDSGGTLRTSIWQQVIGNSFIDSAFVWAHRADPDAKLYLNEYGAEMYGSTKSNAMYSYVTAMKNRGIPITGVGLQCHFTVSRTDFSKLDQNIKQYANAGLETIITELDIRIAKTDYLADSTRMLTAQANDYLSLIRLCLNNPNAKTFVTWGFTDKYSWIPGFTATTGNGPASDYALIFNTTYVTKPAYTSMLNELMTRSQASGVENVSLEPGLNYTLTDNCISIESTSIIHSCKLFDLLGRNYFQNTVNCVSLKIPVTDIPHGWYILLVQWTTGKVTTKKVLL